MGIWLVIAALSMGCSGDQSGAVAAEPDWGPRGPCNPVDPSHCLLPYPNAFFTQTDDAGLTRVDFAQESLPVATDGTPWKPDRWNAKDGFPVLGSLYAHFPGTDLSGVVGLADIGAYEAADVKTIIARADTGERVPHFVEHDMDSAGTDRQLLILRPVAPMAHGARYVVGIRGLDRADGTGAFEAAEGFAKLRDDRGPTADNDLERQRRHYDDDVFPVLEAAGFERAELQMAWDFPTVGRDNTTRVAKHLIADALQRAGQAGAAYVIEETEERDCEDDGAAIGRELKLTLQVPSYVQPGGPGGVFTLGDDGLPEHHGVRAIKMTVKIPCSLLTDEAARPGRLVQYGHGLLGGQDELNHGYLGQSAHRYGWILFATDWAGMSFADVPTILDVLSADRSRFPVIPDRLQQSFADAAVAAQLIRHGALAQDAAMRAADGAALVDPSTLSFYGNSQGAVVGGGYVAASPHVERAVLGVGGTPFMFLATRAEGFAAFRALLVTVYSDFADSALALPVLQMLWDPGESAGWVNSMDKPVLVHAAVGDRSVPTLGAHILARSYGASLVAPATRPVWGLAERAPPFAGSALVEMDWGIPDMELAWAEGHDVQTHNMLRLRREAQDQIATFLTTGTVDHTCAGPCIFEP